jgi:hypothetical protein
LFNLLFLLQKILQLCFFDLSDEDGLVEEGRKRGGEEGEEEDEAAGTEDSQEEEEEKKRSGGRRYYSHAKRLFLIFSKLEI